MMKKATSLLLALVLVLSMTACGKSGVGYADKDGYAEGVLGDTMHTYFFDYTVNSAYITSDFEGYTPAEGNELLVTEVTIKNTTKESIPMGDYDLQAQWGETEDDEAFAWPIEDKVSDKQLPYEYEMAVGEERTGLLVYEVPTGYKDFSLSTIELFDDGSEEGSEGDLFFVFFTPTREDGAAA